MIQDVQDEFNAGLYGADAIRSFLRFVMSTAPGEGWADPKPAYVLLLGDGSYDPKKLEPLVGQTTGSRRASSSRTTST